jgi:hypothetical protein
MKTTLIRGKYATGEVTIGGEPLPIEESLRIQNHSPTGYAWAYAGSGPAQLSLAILLRYTNRETAEAHYQKFKWDVIAKLPPRDFELTEERVKKWLKENAE